MFSNETVILEKNVSQSCKPYNRYVIIESAMVQWSTCRIDKHWTTGSNPVIGFIFFYYFFNNSYLVIFVSLFYFCCLFVCFLNYIFHYFKKKLLISVVAVALYTLSTPLSSCLCCTQCNTCDSFNKTKTETYNQSQVK